MHQVRLSAQLGSRPNWHGRRRTFFISSQPVGEEQEAELWRAAAACPTKSIGNRDQPREPTGVFPYRMTDGVFALGNNALSSFAAHSFLVTRTEGNLMVDSPRFNRVLAESVDALGALPTCC